MLLFFFEKQGVLVWRENSYNDFNLKFYNLNKSELISSLDISDIKDYNDDFYSLHVLKFPDQEHVLIAGKALQKVDLKGEVIKIFDVENASKVFFDDKENLSVLSGTIEEEQKNENEDSNDGWGTVGDFDVYGNNEGKTVIAQQLIVLDQGLNKLNEIVFNPADLFITKVVATEDAYLLLKDFDNWKLRWNYLSDKVDTIQVSIRDYDRVYQAINDKAYFINSAGDRSDFFCYDFKEKRGYPLEDENENDDDEDYPYCIPTSKRGQIILRDIQTGDSITALEQVLREYIDSDYYGEGPSYNTLTTGNLFENVRISPDADYVLSKVSGENLVYVWDSRTGKVLYKLNASKGSFLKDGKKILFKRADKYYSCELSNCIETTKETTYNWDDSYFNNPDSAFPPSHDFVDVDTIVSERYYIEGSSLTPDKKILIIDAEGYLSFYRISDKKLLLKLYFNDESYFCFTPDGLYDGSEKALEDLHFLKGGEVINPDQFKEVYWEPGLLGKVLLQQPIRKVPRLGEAALHPDVRGHLSPDNDFLKLNLYDRGGGIGKIELYVNDMMLMDDISSYASVTSDEIAISVPLKKNLKRFFKTGKINKIKVVPYNLDNTLSGRGLEIEFLGATGSTELPTFHGVFVGVSDYRGDQLDLKYSSQDAKKLADAVEYGANNLFGQDKVNIQVLISEDGYLRPTKKNVLKVLDSIANIANANDLLMLFLGGHGETYTVDSFTDFHFLTADMSSNNLKDEFIRDNYTFSGKEIIEKLNTIPANKKIMVMDACNSGQLSQVFIASRGEQDESSRIRSLERLHDRSGLFFLAGSAADKVSYESGKFDQGLLTYSLLEYLKEKPLRSNEYVDLLSWLNYASYRVPELAADIGGIQEPQFSFPEGNGSFDVGKLSTADREKITLKTAGISFSRPLIQFPSWAIDEVLVNELSALLETNQTRGGLPIRLIEGNYIPGTIQIVGKILEGDPLQLQLRIFRGVNLITTKEISALNRNELASKVVDWINTLELNKQEINK